MNQQEGRPRKIQLTALSRVMDRITQPMPATTPSTIVIGETSRKVFWSVFLVGIFLMSVMVSMIGQNALVLAAVALPGDFTITASKVDATNFNLVPGVSPNLHTPVAVVTMDAKITHQVITKSSSFLGHTVTVTVGTDPNTPSTVTGLTLDVSSLSAANATFTNLTVQTANSPAGLVLTQQANTQVLTNAVINTPFLNASSITLPGLSLSISVS